MRSVLPALLLAFVAGFAFGKTTTTTNTSGVGASQVFVGDRMQEQSATAAPCKPALGPNGRAYCTNIPPLDFD